MVVECLGELKVKSEEKMLDFPLTLPFIIRLSIGLMSMIVFRLMGRFCHNVAQIQAY